AAAAARESGANLVCYPGRLVRSPVEFEGQRNMIYRMVDQDTIDGVVLMGGLNAWVSLDDTYAFIDGLRPLPVVTTGIVLDGIPGVTVDNYRAMHDVINHLVDAHACRRVAFIRGQANHQEADVRYRAYLDVLEAYGIPFDERIVYQGNFKESGGVDGARWLLDESRAPFDALAAASDNMAIGAIKTLQARGLRVPADVAVVGVNGEDQGLVINPPLTTAPLHFFEQAYQATRMTLALLDGRSVPQRVILPARLVLRQSCGCPDPLVTHAGVVPHTEKLDSFTDEIRMLESLVFGEAGAPLPLPYQAPVQQAFPLLLKQFFNESLGRAEGEFIPHFVEMLQRTATDNEAFPRWHDIISTLRQFAVSQLTEPGARLRIENLVQQARVVIGESARRHNAYRVLQADDELHILGEISQSLSVVTSLVELTGVLERTLRLMDIPDGYLFVYDGPQGADGPARFIFAYEDGLRRPIDPQQALFPARRLLPPGLLDPARPCSLVVEPLFFRDDQLGYAVFEADPQHEAIYEILGGQISASMKRTLLTERNIRLYDEALQARQAAEQANLLKSRFLSTVSHELRTPLALITGTIEMMLQEAQAGGLPPLPEAYRQDMDAIRASSKHLSRLIGDVLDLTSTHAGELHLACEALDPLDLFDEAAVLGKSMAREKGLQWREQIPAVLPAVWGDRTRLRQVVINLLSNAVKFTERGYVGLVVRVEGGQVQVEISDSGLGIPPAEQELIFDEFRRSERSVARGYGGMGLGLAISRRLIELHGGTIRARSNGEDGSGSTFCISLPAMVESPASLDACASRSDLVLLLAEDGAASADLQRHLFRKGFQVDLLDVSLQPNWLDQVLACPPGALVLDFQPATERGWELVQLLKQNPRTRDIPV
ncbi:MAG: substrate-binding domain-containing protein, partial [Chloroflexota bacterium]